MRTRALCSEEGCTSIAVAKNLKCGKHRQAEPCVEQDCDKPGKRARGLCSMHWSYQQYGQCINGCLSPAHNSIGICSNCNKRGGPPERFNIGSRLNTDSERWCNTCQELKSISYFTSHKSRCNVCQQSRKSRAYRARRAELFAWQVLNVKQTSEGLCVKCLKPYGDYHLDHIVPESLGGTLDNENCQVLCSTCNIRKGNRESIDYRVRINRD